MYQAIRDNGDINVHVHLSGSYGGRRGRAHRPARPVQPPPLRRADSEHYGGIVMKDPIQTYFQVGLVVGMAYAPVVDELGWEEIVRRVAIDDYFQVIEVNPLPNQAVRERVAALAAQGHLTLYCNAHGRLLSAGLNPNAVDEAERLRAEATLLEGVDESVALGSPTVGMLAGHWTEDTREVCLAQLEKTVLALCRYAQTKGLRVELEVFDHDIAKKSLLGPAPLAARFAARVRTVCPNFGLMADLSHFPMTYETSEQVIPILRPYLTHFHIGNTVCLDPSTEAYGDEHPRFGFPNSSNDIPQVLDFLRVLKANGFFCPQNPYPLTFEIKPWNGEDVDIVIANAKRTLQRAWALLED